MRRAAALCFISLALAGTATARPKSASPAATPAGAPPHAWLFGTWTGGIFPVLDGMTAQDCRSQPTVGFSKDVVSHANLLSSATVERNVETVRATAAGAEFRFAPNADPASTFGCENPDTLHVARSGPNEISFPRCTNFPYPLQRCPAR